MSSSAQAHDSHIAGIPTKGLNVLLDPVEQQLLVLQTQVQQALLGSQVRRQEAERADTVVEVDGNHGILGPGHETRHIALNASTRVESTAMHIDNDGQLGLPLLADTKAIIVYQTSGSVEIQVEAILAHFRAQEPITGTCLAEPQGIERLRRGGQRFGGPEAVFAGRGLRIGNATKSVEGAGEVAGRENGRADVPALAEGNGWVGGFGRAGSGLRLGHV